MPGSHLRARRSGPPLAGVGIDLSEPERFDHLPQRVVARAAHRWLDLPERAWCVRQPSFRHAMVIVLSCKEAIFKAVSERVGFTAIPLAMQGCLCEGRARARPGWPRAAAAVWSLQHGRILCLAAAGPGADDVLRRLGLASSP